VRKIAADAANAQDFDTLWTLRVELPAYLAAKGSSADLLLSVHALNEVSALASKDVQAALVAQDELDRGCYRLGVAFAHARHAVEIDASSVHVPGWTSDDHQQVSFGGSVALR
jgi:hypothetical protein